MHLSLIFLSFRDCEVLSLYTPLLPMTEVTPQCITWSCFSIWGSVLTSGKNFTQCFFFSICIWEHICICVPIYVKLICGRCCAKYEKQVVWSLETILLLLSFWSLTRQSSERMLQPTVPLQFRLRNPPSPQSWGMGAFGFWAGQRQESDLWNPPSLPKYWTDTHTFLSAQHLSLLCSVVSLYSACKAIQLI